MSRQFSIHGIEFDLTEADRMYGLFMQESIRTYKKAIDEFEPYFRSVVKNINEQNAEKYISSLMKKLIVADFMSCHQTALMSCL